MEILLKRFPIEISYYIMRYTYMPQNKNLLHDIVNFTEKKQELYERYLLYYNQDYERQEYINWLSNDIVLYTNNFRNTGIEYGGGYIDIFYKRLGRNPFLKSKEMIDKYVINLFKKGGVKKEINVYLGLLTAKERDEFIQWHISKG